LAASAVEGGKAVCRKRSDCNRVYRELSAEEEPVKAHFDNVKRRSDYGSGHTAKTEIRDAPPLLRLLTYLPAAECFHPDSFRVSGGVAVDGGVEEEGEAEGAI